MKPLVWFSAVFIVILMIGCSSDIDTPTISENDTGQAMLAPAPYYTENQINQKILTGASKQIGWWGGQCKTWVQNLVPQVVSGRTIGPNNTSTSSNYYNAQWNPVGNARTVWQLYPKNYCVTSFPTNILKPGQIIQLRWKSTVPWPCCKCGPHTAIIQSVSSTNMQWYDSNYFSDGIVRSHSFSGGQWQQYVDAWTVYQVQ